jgi:hypothetical protein
MRTIINRELLDPESQTLCLAKSRNSSEFNELTISPKLGKIVG